MSPEKPFLDRYHTQNGVVQEIASQTIPEDARPRRSGGGFNRDDLPGRVGQTVIERVVLQAALELAEGDASLIRSNLDGSVTVYNSVAARQAAISEDIATNYENPS